MNVSSLYDQPESNYRMVHEAMLAKAPLPPENMCPIPTDEPPEEATLHYERTPQEAYSSPVLNPARPFFDVTLLGLGTDGHTASLLPEEPVLQERKRWVVAVSHGRPEVRITATYPVIESSGRIAFLVTGKEKATRGNAVPRVSVQAPQKRNDRRSLGKLSVQFVLNV